MRSNFDKQLVTLNDMLIEMGGLIETAIAMAIKALEKQDTELAKKAIAFDDKIDQMEKDIEALCLKLLLHQQPVARDLLLISAALKMITDMERIGDHAGDISEITLMLIGTPFIKQPDNIIKMAHATVKMVTQSVDAFVNKDAALANEVIEEDDVVDKLFDKVKFDIIEHIRENSEYGEQAIDLIMIAKYFERIGDHATNIAEWVVFSITGMHKFFGEQNG